jgi:hypothetical protein
VFHKRFGTHCFERGKDVERGVRVKRDFTGTLSAGILKTTPAIYDSRRARIIFLCALDLVAEVKPISGNRPQFDVQPHPAYSSIRR